MTLTDKLWDRFTVSPKADGLRTLLWLVHWENQPRVLLVGGAVSPLLLHMLTLLYGRSSVTDKSSTSAITSSARFCLCMATSILL